MIIVINDTTENKKAANKLATLKNLKIYFYPDPIKEEVNDLEKIILLDLTNSSIPYIMIREKAEEIAEYLNENNLLTSLKLIDVVIPDIENSLPQFAQQFSYALKEFSHRDIKVRTYYDTTFKNVVIVPPEQQNEKWKIFGSNEKFSLFNPSKKHNSTLLWEGENIENCFDEKIFNRAK